VASLAGLLSLFFVETTIYFRLVLSIPEPHCASPEADARTMIARRLQHNNFILRIIFLSPLTVKEVWLV
jgi:hypothetical protein